MNSVIDIPVLRKEVNHSLFLVHMIYGAHIRMELNGNSLSIKLLERSVSIILQFVHNKIYLQY